MCKIQQLILNLTFLLWKSVSTVLIIFADPFVDTLTAGFRISSHVITESSTELAKYSPFLQLQVAGFQL